MGFAGLYRRSGGVGVVGLAVLYFRGGGVGVMAPAIMSLRDAGGGYSSNIRGFRRNGVGEGVGICE
jgi:hypothetical protein